MKKYFCFIAVVVWFLGSPFCGFSEPGTSTVENAVDQVSANASGETSSQTEALDPLQHQEPAELEDKTPQPIDLTVEEKKQEEPEEASMTTPEGKTMAPDLASDSSTGSSKKKTPQAKISTGNEMQQNWEALFSKKETPGSLLYVVQPGDSLYVIAQENHTTVELIKKLNHLKNDTIYAGKKLKIYKGTFSIFVSKSKNILILSANGKPIKKYSVATGKNNSTPIGEFKIVNKLTNPTWFRTGAILPPGSPENGLGTRWMGFDKEGYGIHGTIEPESIGKQASEGCIRMYNKDVEEVYSLVPTGTKVIVKD